MSMFEAVFGRGCGPGRVPIAKGTASMIVPEGTAAVLPLWRKAGRGEVYVALAADGMPLSAVRVHSDGPDTWTEEIQDLASLVGLPLYAPVAIYQRLDGTCMVSFGTVRVGEPLSEFTRANAWRARG